MLLYNCNTGISDWSGCTRCGLSRTRRRVAIRRDGLHRSGGLKILFIGEAPGKTEDSTGEPFTGTAGRILETIFDYIHHPFTYLITNVVGCTPCDLIEHTNKEDPDLYPVNTEKGEIDFGPNTDNTDNNTNTSNNLLSNEHIQNTNIQQVANGPTINISDNNSNNNNVLSVPPITQIAPTTYTIINYNRTPTSPEKEVCKPHIDELIITFQPRGVVYLGKEAMSFIPPQHLATVHLLHPAYIARLECKVLTMKKEARKLTTFLEGLGAFSH